MFCFIYRHLFPLAAKSEPGQHSGLARYASSCALVHVVVRRSRSAVQPAQHRSKLDRTPGAVGSRIGQGHVVGHDHCLHGGGLDHTSRCSSPGSDHVFGDSRGVMGPAHVFDSGWSSGSSFTGALGDVQWLMSAETPTASYFGFTFSSKLGRPDMS